MCLSDTCFFDMQLRFNRRFQSKIGKSNESTRKCGRFVCLRLRQFKECLFVFVMAERLFVCK